MSFSAVAIEWRAFSGIVTALTVVGFLTGCGQSSSVEKPVEEVRGAPIKTLPEKPTPTGAAQVQPAQPGTPMPPPAASPSVPVATSVATAAASGILPETAASATTLTSALPATAAVVGATTNTTAGSANVAAARSVAAGAVTGTGTVTPVSVDGRAVALSFDQLAGYTFEVTDELLGPITNNVVAAAEKTNAKIPETVKSYDRKKVSLRGFMLPLKVEGGLVTEMLIMKDQSMCCYGTTPRINDWVSVKMKSKGVRPMMDLPVTLSGTMRVGEMRENGYLVGIYSMDGESMEAPEP